MKAIVEIIEKNTQRNNVVIWQGYNEDECGVGEPALIIKYYSDMIEIKQGDSEVLINYETVPELIKTLKNIKP